MSITRKLAKLILTLLTLPLLVVVWLLKWFVMFLYVGKKFLPVTAAASSNANTNVSMMGETFKYCAPIASALGFSAEDP